MSLWSCTTCSKSFARKGDLTRHTSIHTGIKPHVCETCGKGFAQFSGLKTHRNVHSKAKPFICGIGTCTKAFGDPSSRTRHRKETHSREGAYKCTVAGCGTRIKRRSAFFAHLRKHGLDPESLDLSTTGLVPAPAQFAFPDAETHDKVEPHNASSFLGDSPGYHTLGDGGETIHPVDRNVRPDAHDPLGYWSRANDALPLDVDLPGDVYSYLSSSFEDPLYFDGIFPTVASYSLHVASPLNLSTFEPFLEARSDGSQSSTSSPSSTYLTLFPTDFDDDTVSLPPTDNALQGPFLYNLL